MHSFYELCLCRQIGEVISVHMLHITDHISIKFRIGCYWLDDRCSTTGGVEFFYDSFK